MGPQPYRLLVLEDGQTPNDSDVKGLLEQVQAEQADCLDALLDLHQIYTDSCLKGTEEATVLLMLRSHVIRTLLDTYKQSSDHDIKKACLQLFFAVSGTSVSHQPRPEAEIFEFIDNLVLQTISGDDDISQAAIAALVHYGSPHEMQLLLSNTITLHSAASYLSIPVETSEDPLMILERKTRIIKLITSLLNEKIVFSTAKDCVNAAAALQAASSSRASSIPKSLSDAWDNLSIAIYALFQKARSVDIIPEASPSSSSARTGSDPDTARKRELTELRSFLATVQRELKRSKERAEKLETEKQILIGQLKSLGAEPAVTDDDGLVEFSTLPGYTPPSHPPTPFHWSIHDRENILIDNNVLTLFDGGIILGKDIISSGIWRFDVYFESSGTFKVGLGIVDSQWKRFSEFLGNDRNSMDWNCKAASFHNSEQYPGLDSFDSSEAVGLEVDMDKRRLAFYKNGRLQSYGYCNLPSSIRLGFCASDNTSAYVLYYGKLAKPSSPETDKDDFPMIPW